METLAWVCSTLVLAGSTFLAGRYSCRCQREKRFIDATFKRRPTRPPYSPEELREARPMVGPAQWDYKPRGIPPGGKPASSVTYTDAEGVERFRHNLG